MKYTKPIFVLGFLLTMVIFFSCSQERSLPPNFELEPGYEMQLVASEPLIKDPVDLEFDERGRAYVLEMPGYPYEDQSSRIVQLVDADKDGVFEDQVVFAERLELACSILPYKNGILVAAPPYLLHVADKDGDGISDQRDTLMGGFSTGNLQHNYNGLSYGIDNWIYAANGGNSGAPYWWGDTTSVMEVKGDDMRFDLANKKMERVGRSSGGFELGFDEYGRMYETHNLEHLSQLIFPRRYHKDQILRQSHALVNISDHEENGLARIYPIGEQETRVNHPEQSGYFSGACGTSYYGGQALGNDMNNTVWIADVVLNLVHVDKINSNGSDMVASRLLEGRDFLASRDRAFRPVNFSVGPDGAMYLVDMYRDVIEHPEWIPDDVEKDLDLNAGKDKGRIYKISKSDAKVAGVDFDAFANATSASELLSHSNQWVRLTAQRIIMENELAPPTVKLLKEHLHQDKPEAYLHAMWILSLQNKLSSAEINAGLEHGIAGIRENTLMIAEKNWNDETIPVAIKMLSDENQRVRMQAALSLSMMDEDQFEANKADLLKAIQASSRLEMDVWNMEALAILGKNNLIDLAKMLAKDPQNKLLPSLAFAAAENPQNLQSMLVVLNESDFKEEDCLSMISAILEYPTNYKASKSITQLLEKLEVGASAKLLTALTKCKVKLGATASPSFVKLSQSSLQKVKDQQLSLEERMDHLDMISLLSFADKKESLYALLDNTEALALQESAMKQLWKTDEPEVGYHLVKEWASLGPQTRRAASDVLLYKEEHHDALLSGLENKDINIGEMNFDLERRRTLLWWTDNETTKRRAEALFSDSGVVNRKEVMHSMAEALHLEGSIEKGKETFDLLCGQCHMYGKDGADVGPVLTEINRKSKASLLHDILDPNAAVDPKYINHQLKTKDGEVHIGMVDNESDEALSIVKIGGTNVTIPKNNIESLRSMGTSMMPEGLEADLSVQDLADLLSYLQNSEE